MREMFRLMAPPQMAAMTIVIGTGSSQVLEVLYVWSPDGSRGATT